MTEVTNIRVYTSDTGLYCTNSATFKLCSTRNFTTWHYAAIMLLLHRTATILQLLIVGNEKSYEIAQDMTVMVE
jgi:hypothetical protein